MLCLGWFWIAVILVVILCIGGLRCWVLCLRIYLFVVLGDFVCLLAAFVWWLPCCLILLCYSLFFCVCLLMFGFAADCGYFCLFGCLIL